MNMLAPDFGDPEFMADMHGIIELGAPICTDQQLKSWVYAGVKQWEGPSKGGGGGSLVSKSLLAKVSVQVLPLLK